MGPPTTATGAGGDIVLVASAYDPLGDEKKIATIAHEIGHLLGLGHLYEQEYEKVSIQGNPPTQFEIQKCPPDIISGTAFDPLPEPLRSNLLALQTMGNHGGALMNPSVACMGEQRVSETKWAYPSPFALQEYDRLSYRGAYAPAAPIDLNIVDLPDDRVRLTWRAPNTYFEKNFTVWAKIVLKANGRNAWTWIETASRNTHAVEFERPGTPGGLAADTSVYTLVSDEDNYATYRIIAESEAVPRADLNSSVKEHAVRRVSAGGSGAVQPLCTGTKTLTVAVSPFAVSGSVSVSGHQSVSNGRYVFDCGDEAMVEATPSHTPTPGYRFVRWGGSGCSGTKPECTLTMNLDRSAVAVFEEVNVPGEYEHRTRQVPTTTWSWTASCNGASGSGSGYASEVQADLALATWALNNNCGSLGTVRTTLEASSYTTWSWAAACTQPAGVTGSGSGYSTSSAASSAGWAWVASACDNTTDDPEPLEPSEVTVSADTNVATYYRWNATCTVGGATGTGTASTQSAAISAGSSWLSANCSTSLTSNVSSQPGTRTDYSYRARCESTDSWTNGPWELESEEEARDVAWTWLLANCD